MKHYFYLFLALCMGAVVMTSCKPKNGVSETEYQVIAKLHSYNSNLDQKVASEEQQKLLTLLKDNGYECGKRVTVKTADKAKMVADLKELAKKVRHEAGEVKGYYSLEMTGIESQYADLNDKAHPWEVYENLSFGKQPDEDEAIPYSFAYKDCIAYTVTDVNAWVKSVNTLGFWDSADDNGFYADMDLNSGAGGDFIYMQLLTDGYEKSDNWVEDHRKDYITDLIIIYGGGQPDSIVIDGRTYRQEVSKDFNKGAHGEYVYLYATRDYYDGRYLWVGSMYNDDCGQRNCCAYYEDKDFDISQYCHEPWNANGYDIVQRIIPAYDTNGNYKEQANFNKDTDGWTIKMFMCYRKHD